MGVVSDIARQVLSDVGSDAGLLLAAQWVSRRYHMLVDKVRFRALRRYGEVVQPATIIAGTVTVTQGSPVVTPDATALTAWTAVPAGDLVGRFLRFQDSTWYEITQFDGAVVTLKSPYVATTAAGIGYNLAARYLTLAADARWLGTFTLARMWRPLDVIPLAVLDAQAPSRNWAQGTPGCVADFGLTADGRRLVEVYPYAAQPELIAYIYWALPLALEFNDPVPSMIEDYVLQEGALIDAMRWMAAQAVKQGQLDQAAYWRNEYRSQETTWKTKINDAIRADRGVDDISFIVQGYGSRYANGWGYDIRTAHDQVWSQWFGGS